MHYLAGALSRAVDLILSLDPAVMEIAGLSIKLAAISTLIAAVIGIPVGFILGTYDFPGRSFLASIVNTLLSLPTVVVGLAIYSFISRRGPLGRFGLLFTPTAIILGQAVLATPIVTALTMNATRSLERDLQMTALSLGASRVQVAYLLLLQARFAVLGALVAAFGRVIAEVGAAMMLGGNIEGYTRTITTAIALETSKGEFAFALSLGIILLLVSFVVNILVHYFQQVKHRGGVYHGESSPSREFA
ncbi:MAG: ABC transporter permease [Firmicutes bacterium]|nr:ABC transporter permease [Bacillota bacterium]